MSSVTAALSGLVLVEMRYCRERAQEAAEAGAELIVTASPYDKRYFQPVGEAIGLAVPDLCQILASSLVAGG